MAGYLLRAKAGVNVNLSCKEGLEERKLFLEHQRHHEAAEKMALRLSLALSASNDPVIKPSGGKLSSIKLFVPEEQNASEFLINGTFLVDFSKVTTLGAGIELT